ncbi:restriction endonuclease subunit S [Salinicoccus halodurans]|uniref:Type I restriction enzyme, S subunit n=1 Tax=Salinicoccus halodurans TaxID=407035 RepID=A0AA94HIY1_9STAP|nr:restriction endonuclease subunit S [Salinicoccus halodurans]SFK92941.1 type I restriction enzyme, S subunit [Salinicoccus halodurans]
MSNYSTWKTKSFSQCVEKIIDHRGKTPKKLGLEWGNGNILALSANNVKKGKIDTSIEAYYGSEELYERWMTKGKVNKGDVIMTMEAPLGNVTQIPDNKKYILSQRVAAFKTIEDIDNDYFKYYLTSNKFQNLLYRFSTGTTAKGISQKNLRPLPVSYPSIKEQQKIASILSSVDEAIEKTKQILEQTEKIKIGVRYEMLTRGLQNKELKSTPVGTIPMNWEVLPFGEVFDRITKKNKEDNQNVLTISGEKGLVSQLEYFNKSVSSKNLSKYILLEYGDFAYNKSYSNGYPLGAIKKLEKYDKGVVSTLYICFRLKGNNDIDFYKHYFDSGLWNKQVYNIAPEGGRSHGLLNVGVRDFFKILIPVPSLEEQKEIRKKIESINNKIHIEKQRLDELINIKRGLMQQLLTGKVRVPTTESEEVPQ